MINPLFLNVYACGSQRRKPVYVSGRQSSITFGNNLYLDYLTKLSKVVLEDAVLETINNDQIAIHPHMGIGEIYIMDLKKYVEVLDEIATNAQMSIGEIRLEQYNHYFDTQGPDDVSIDTNMGIGEVCITQEYTPKEGKSFDEHIVDVEYSIGEIMLSYQTYKPIVD